MKTWRQNYVGKKRKIKSLKRLAVKEDIYNRGKNLGVYVHVPFCASKCGYCDFYSVLYDEKAAAAYFDAVIAHIRETAGRFPGYTVDTVYFGGGTPTVLPPGKIASILREIKRGFRLVKGAEITLEANPATIDLSGLRRLRWAGFNRISCGMQSANDETLALISRKAKSKDAALLLRNSRRAGFKSVGADLIYGLPGEKHGDFMRSLEFLLSFKPDHISLYNLKLADGTPLYEAKESHDLPSDEEEWRMFDEAAEALEKCGYEHYEISNFARPGHRSRHNTRYWELSEYLAFGPSAHAYTGGRRYSFVPDAATYARGITARDSVIEDIDDKPLPFSERQGEYMMLMLRTADGVNPDMFFKAFGKSFEPYEAVLEKYTKTGHAVFEEGRWRLTRKGWFVSNTILSELI